MENTLSKVLLIAIIIGLSLGSSTWAEDETLAEPNLTVESTDTQQKPLIQMAILLDTSGSMTGLIDQARAELWAIVNEFIFAKRAGKEPLLQVALYEYGNNSLTRNSGYIRQIVPLTTDLDKISEELFALTTNGGDEYCGWVIKEATQSLKWSDNPDDLKVIFIAGNEPFTQGPVDYLDSCKTAISKGIVVNTIHCGSENDGINGKWKDGAVLADGEFLNIDHNRRTIHIESPQDKEIAELDLKLNETYLAFGQMGDIAGKRQSAQDLNASAISKEAAVQRAVTKSSRNYRNTTWDLVDAIKIGNKKLEDVKTEDLPENMQKMTMQERKAYIEAQAKKRAEIQDKIQQLNEQRKKYVAEEMKKRQKKGETLGSAIISAIREQAVEKNFTFESSVKPSRNVESID
jgi:hypothetical protein